MNLILIDKNIIYMTFHDISRFHIRFMKLSLDIFVFTFLTDLGLLIFSTFSIYFSICKCLITPKQL